MQMRPCQFMKGDMDGTERGDIESSAELKQRQTDRRVWFYAAAIWTFFPFIDFHSTKAAPMMDITAAATET
jgi:hypothetical protein